MEVTDLNENYIKLEVDDDKVKSILSEYYGLSGGKLQKLDGYDDLNYKYSLDSVSDSHKSLWPHGYIMKITNHLDSKNTDLCEAQNILMLFLKDNKIPAPVPVRTVSGKFYAKVKILLINNKGKSENEHLVRLLQYLPGTLLKDVSLTYSIIFKLGKFTALLTNTLKKFSHQVFKTHSSIWHLHNVPQTKKYLEIVQNIEQRRLANDIIYEFVRYVLPKQNTLEQGVIHGDLNENNLLLSKTEEGLWDFSGVLDFGDVHQSCCIFDLAIALCYMMLECKRQNLDPIAGAGHLLAGYIAVRKSKAIDFNLLKICVCARLCQSLILGLKAHNLNPQNLYVLSSQPNGWALVQFLWNTDINEIARIWNSVLQIYHLSIDNE